MRVMIRYPKENVDAVTRALDTYWDEIDEREGEPCFNPDQDLIHDPVSHALTYTGQRHPFHADGAAQVFAAAYYGPRYTGQGFPHSLRDRFDIVEYSTSEPVLHWSETAEQLLTTLASGCTMLPGQREFLSSWIDRALSGLEGGNVLATNGSGCAWPNVQSPTAAAAIAAGIAQGMLVAKLEKAP